MRKVLLVDIRLWCYLHYHRKESILNVFTALANMPIQGFNKIFFVYDDGKSTYHKALYSDYKENRTIKRDAMTPSEKERYKEFSRQYKVLKDVSKYFGTNISINPSEADTMIEVLADTLLKQGNEVYIASSDGDFLTLLDIPNLFVITAKYEVMDYEAVVLKKGATPHQLFLSKCLAGDTKDHLFGLEGLGEIKSPSTGAKIKKIFNEQGDNFQDVCNALQKQVDLGKLKLPENYPSENPVKTVDDLYYFNFRLNEPFKFGMLTKEHQEDLMAQANVKKVAWNEDEFHMKLFEEFGTSIYITKEINNFFRLF